MEGPEFAGERFPSLENMLDLTRGRVLLNLDFQTADVVAPGVAVERDVGLTVTSWSADARWSVLRSRRLRRTRSPQLLNLEDLPAGIDPAEARAVAHRTIGKVSASGAAGINLHHTLVDAALVARAREVGLGVWVFGVDDEERFGELIGLGVTTATANWLERMLAMQGSRSSVTPGETDG